ncbi:MAG: response regulator [Verrucomicrobia bacterium]|nr:response regulator [Verrucomicrobiota bacterium]
MDTTSNPRTLPHSETPKPKPTLLIVDDEEGPRQALRVVFKNDYHVLLATNGLGAVEFVKTQPVDVVILDIMMSGMSGVETLKEIKTINPAVEVILLTAFETIETARQALRLGASDYLNKPFEISTIRAAVSLAVKKHHASRDFQRGNQELLSLQEDLRRHQVAEELARSQGEIYASVLHDINSPLTIISGFAELIHRSMENAASVEGEQLANIKEDLQRLNGQIARCVEISKRYLSFLHAQPSAKSSVAVNQVMSDLTELLNRHPATHGNRLTIQGLDHDLFVAINGTDFLQILLNLTINALQSSPDPHLVEVSCHLSLLPIPEINLPDDPHLRVINQENFPNTPPFLSITVRDTGPGIPPEILSKMFNERVTTKAPDAGTGLGLSIVKRLILQADGALIVQSPPGKGASFTLCLQAPTSP